MASNSRASSLPVLALAGAAAGALIVAVLNIAGIGPFGSSADAQPGGAVFAAVPVDDVETAGAPTTTSAAPDDTTVTTTTEPLSSSSSTTTSPPDTTTTTTVFTLPDFSTTTTAAPPTTAAPATTQPPVFVPPTTTVSEIGSAYLMSLSSSTVDQGPAWVAVVTARIADENGVNIGNATVSALWTTGGEAGSCTTDSSGTCTVFQSTLTDADPSTTFSVQGVTAPGYAYAGARTGASQITVSQP